MTLPPGERVAAELAAEGLPTPDIVIEPDGETLARAAGEALVARLAAAQPVHGSASVVLSGGGIGIAGLEHVARLAAEPVRETVDWTAVDVWWGDERFVPVDSDERNEKATRRALLDKVGVPEPRGHPMRASDVPVDGPENGAGWDGEQLVAGAPE